MRKEVEAKSTETIKRAHATVTLHLEDGDDQPLEIDADMVLSCTCGNTERKRFEIYQTVDVERVLCLGCEASYDVTTHAEITFRTSIKVVDQGLLTKRSRRRVLRSSGLR